MSLASRLKATSLPIPLSAQEEKALVTEWSKTGEGETRIRMLNGYNKLATALCVATAALAFSAAFVFPVGKDDTHFATDGTLILAFAAATTRKQRVLAPVVRVMDAQEAHQKAAKELTLRGRDYQRAKSNILDEVFLDIAQEHYTQALEQKEQATKRYNAACMNATNHGIALPKTVTGYRQKAGLT